MTRATDDRTAPDAPAGPAGAFPHVQRVTTRWHDNDVFGHLNNTIYYSLMDTTVTQWLLERGGVDLARGGVMAVVASSGCEYRASASFPDVLLVGLRAGRIGTTSVTWEFALHREGDGLLVAEGRWVHVFLDKATGRPTPVPQVLRERIAEHLSGS